MSDCFICEECDNGTYNLQTDETKAEELTCSFCSSEADCLLEGKAACVNCKMNRRARHKSPAGSFLSDHDSHRGVKKTIVLDTLKPPGSTIASALLKGMEAHGHKRGDSSVPVEHFRAHKFLQKYIVGDFAELVCLYNTKSHGMNAAAFHGKCDDCKHGLIVIVKLTLGYQIAAFTWKGIRKGISQANDSQMGGAIIKNNNFEFVSFRDKLVYSVPEGIRFSTENDLYLNFDDKERSLCGFDQRLRGSQQWTTYIDEISVYKLLIAD